MGLTLLLCVVIYLIIFTRIRKDLGKRKQNGTGQAASSSGTVRTAGTARRTTNPFRREHAGPEACEDEHAYCSHITVDGKFRDFENRENDWLARQMEEEAKAAKKLDFLR